MVSKKSYGRSETAKEILYLVECGLCRGVKPAKHISSHQLNELLQRLSGKNIKVNAANVRLQFLSEQKHGVSALSCRFFVEQSMILRSLLSPLMIFSLFLPLCRRSMLRPYNRTQQMGYSTSHVLRFIFAAQFTKFICIIQIVLAIFILYYSTIKVLCVILAVLSFLQEVLTGNMLNSLPSIEIITSSPRSALFFYHPSACQAMPDFNLSGNSLFDIIS